MQDFSFGNLLTSYRQRLGWEQKKIANPDDPEALPISLRTYQGWENGERIPSNKWLHRIAAFFQLTDADADALYRAAGQVAPQIHNLPFPQNPFFTGRDTYLEQLEQHIDENGSITITQPTSISGLGGIGKTQLALEYAHRSYPKVYRAIFWVNAANKVTLEEGYLSLAHLLELPEKNEREIDLLVQAVKIWLERHTGWLLILDNADNLQLARSFLPTKPHGHILLTTRSQIVGNIAARIEIDAMEPDEGLIFLLRRSDILKDGAELEAIALDTRNAAKQLVEILGGHPLALDQAGAYIEETKASFLTYMRLYSDQRLILLNERGLLGIEHPDTVVVTFEMNFQRMRELDPAAADLLYFCSFLYPDDIPEELFSEGLKLNIVTFNNSMKVLRSYSLIKRNTEKKTLSIHRLVQAVLQDIMEVEKKKWWMKQAVLAVNAVFPYVEFAQWSTCERLLPQALLCATWIEQESMTSSEAARLLNQSGSYLSDRAHYIQAEPLLCRALKTRELLFGQDHPDTTASLNNLASLYVRQGKYVEAEPLCQRALEIAEKIFGLGDSEVSIYLHNLADLYERQGRYAEAEPLYQRALSIRGQRLDGEHAISLSNLATLYLKQGKYNQAELACQQALAMNERLFGIQHPITANILNNLALIYMLQGKYARAEPLYRRALAIHEQVDAQSPNVAAALNNLVGLYIRQGKYAEAETLFQRFLALHEQQSGQEALDTADTLHSLASLYMSQGKYAEAEVLYKRVLTITEQLSTQNPEAAASLNDLAHLYVRQGRYTEAESMHQRALVIREQMLGPQHTATAQSLNNLAGIYVRQGRYAEAEPLYQRALAINEHQFGTQHPEVATNLNNLAYLYEGLGRYAEAEVLYKRALAIGERTPGSDNSDIPTHRFNLAGLYAKQGRYTDAEPLLHQALAIYERQFGAEHPFTLVAREMHNSLLQVMKQNANASLSKTDTTHCDDDTFLEPPGLANT